ncbi:phage baseplate assembly protein V [Teredinibacter sp. KSP-S5-2]|uniref:phage baseplate assembly protein V n=1 Tax=Teredinibacter sp. KSP-S5-2 TaxID=3034506 RepID=UPI0029350731|nr:phage baseplate assembly protein V [Teredinibacter sp. KSP-S5-2]WNO11495.1 phage baseplate assembly protein V [Teredinibacter sp. KSP-S5-2]
MLNNAYAQIMQPQEDAQRSGRIQGLRYAEVIRIEEEGHILQWLSGNVATESAPARVASFMAGKERGAFFAPEVGDEVVVGFEEGDLDSPVILGALWSDVDAPPTQADTSEDNNIRTIVSRMGHEITFDDTQGEGKVLIKTKAGLQALMEDKDSKVTIKVDDSNMIEITNTGITLLAGTTLTLKVNDSNKIEISASGVTVSGQTINLN